MKNITIKTICIIPFVTTDVKNPISEPMPDLTASWNCCLSTNNSPMTAPKNGPSKIPAKGKTNGPIINPIVLPHIPALLPPNFFTPIMFEIVSAAKSSTIKIISIVQNHQVSSLKEKNIPYNIKPAKINKTEGIIG